MNNTLAISSDKKDKRVLETWQLYLLITFITVILSYAFQKFIITRDVYYAIYGEQLEADRIDQIFDLTKKFQLWGYLITPLTIWLRISFVAFLIQLPLMLKYIEIPFKEIFRITAFALLALLSVDVIKFFYLYFLPGSSITADTLSFIPLAITNFLPRENYSEIVFALLGKINPFEFLWIFIVYRGLHKTGKLEKTDALIYSLGTWIGILILSFALTMFLSSL